MASAGHISSESSFLETELRVKPLFNPSRDVRGLWHRAPSSCPCPRKIISCFQFYIEYHLMLLRPPGTHIAREKNYFLLQIWLPSASSLGVPPPQQVHRTSSLSDVAAPSTQCKTDSLCLRAASRARTFESVIQIVIGIALGLPHQQKTWYTWPLTKSERGGQAVTLTLHQSRRA